jgi:hypothetical protein
VTITLNIILLRTRNVSDKICRENKNNYFALDELFSENRAVSEILLENMVQQDRPHTIIQGVSLATEPGISLIILTPMKILQRNLNRGTFVV